jgi:hypothetical protein
MYDKIKFVTSANLKTKDDVVSIEVLEHKLNIDQHTNSKQLPVRNKLKMTKNDYREFLSTLGFSTKYFKSWIN